MTKYEELNSQFIKYEQTLNAFRDNCHDFYVALRNQIIEQFKIPSENLFFVPAVSEDEKKDFVNTPILPMELYDDGYWHIKMVFVFELGRDTFPKDHIWIELMVKEMNNEYEVKLSNSDKTFTYKDATDINLLNLDDIIGCIYDILKSYYQNTLANFMRSKAAEKRAIGFRR